MKKKTIVKSLGLVLAFLVSATLNGNTATVTAATGPTVTFSESHQITYSGYTANPDGTMSFGSSFAGIAPGETRTLVMTLENESSETAHFYMNASTLIAFEEAENAAGAGYDITLSFGEGADPTMIFSSSLGGFQSASPQSASQAGLGQLNDSSLGDEAVQVLVATLGAGASGSLNFEIYFDGNAMTNSTGSAAGADYSQLLSRLGFQFAVRYDTAAGPATVTQQGAANIVQQARELVQSVAPATGDNSRIGMALFALGLGIFVLIATSNKKRERNQDEKEKLHK